MQEIAENAEGWTRISAPFGGRRQGGSNTTGSGVITTAGGWISDVAYGKPRNLNFISSPSFISSWFTNHP